MTDTAPCAVLPVPSGDVPELMAEKARCRQMAKQRRSEAHRTLANTAPQAVRDHWADLDLADAVLSAYLPISDELDTMPILTASHAAGWRCCVPVVPGRDRPLIFRAWWPGVPLIAGRFKVQVPAPTIEEREPDVLLIPLLAFDRRGYRMGYGGGFYDRTLADLRARKAILAIGVAYAAQEVEKVPVGAYDQLLDAVLTERGVIAFSGRLRSTY